MKKFLILFASIFILTGCYNDFKREEHLEEPVRVVISYTLDSVVIDTIQRSNNSSLHIPESYLNNVPDDVVDLNDIFSSGDNDPTDYNYTELSEEEWKYLEQKGIYWDDELGYWRKYK